jgi:AcrR family transcriptional regulator
MVNTRSASGTTGERLLEAGLALFEERGYTGTTVRDLALACGLTPGALYNHFASKDDLLFAIVDRVHDRADAVLSDALRTSGADPKRQLEALARDFTLFHIEWQRETRITNRDYIYLPAGQRASVVRRRRRIRALFADVLREGERRGDFALAELGEGDAVEAASMAILGMTQEVAVWFRPGGPRSARELAELQGRLALRIARAPAR